MTVITQKLTELQLVNKPTVVLSPNLLSQISYLHHKVKGKEWSGFVLYKQEGGIDSIDQMVLTCEHIHIFNIGSATLTKFEDYDPFEIEEDLGQDVYKYKIGVIHTHHSMDAFFSITDMNDLHENAESYPFLLSLIVNFAEGGSPVAKIAFTGKDTFEERTLSTNSRLKDLKVTLNEKEKTRDVLVLCDCKIEYGVQEYFSKRYSTLKEKESITPYSPAYGGYGKSTQGAYNHSYNHYSPKHQGILDFDKDEDKTDNPFKDKVGKWREKDKKGKKNKHKKPGMFGDWKGLMGDKKKISSLDLTDAKIESFLISVVQCDMSAVDISLFVALKRLDSNSELQDEVMKSMWLDMIEDNLSTWVEEEFGVLTQENLNLLYSTCQSTLEKYPTCKLADEVSTIFYNQITEEVSEQAKKWN